MSYGNQYRSNPYNQGPAAENGYQEQHEMQSYGQQQAVMSQDQFLNTVSAVRDLMRQQGAELEQMDRLHRAALTSGDGGAGSGGALQQVEALRDQTQRRNREIRARLGELEADAAATTDGSRALKKRQFDSLNADFKKELQRYLQMEQAYRGRYQEQFARQYRIANPTATDDDVQQAAQADWSNEGVFQSALLSNRSGQMNEVLGNVRARQNELQKIERSIVELASMFQDLETLVVQQDAVVVRADEQTARVNENLDKGNEEVDRGIKHARNRRKLKWWCFFICVLIVLAIALGVGLGYGLVKSQSNNNKSS